MGRQCRCVECLRPRSVYLAAPSTHAGEGWTRFIRHFAINVAIGLVLMFVLALPFVQKNAALATLQDGLINWQMDKLKGVESASEIVDRVDEKTYREWGEPLMTRRDKLAALIDFAMQHEPRAVIVDVDFSAPSRIGRGARTRPSKI